MSTERNAPYPGEQSPYTKEGPEQTGDRSGVRTLLVMLAIPIAGLGLYWLSSVLVASRAVSKIHLLNLPGSVIAAAAVAGVLFIALSLFMVYVATVQLRDIMLRYVMDGKPFPPNFLLIAVSAVALSCVTIIATMLYMVAFYLV